MASTDVVYKLPDDTANTGRAIRHRQRVIAGVTQSDQYVTYGDLPTYYLWTGAIACAANKYFLGLLNTSSNQVIKIKKLFAVNTQLASVTGVALEFDVLRASAITGGGAVLAVPARSDNPAAGIAVGTSLTSATTGSLLYPLYTTNDEVGATNGFPTNLIQQVSSLQPEGLEIQELNLLFNEGFVIKQITSTSVGSFGFLVVFALDRDT